LLKPPVQPVVFIVQATLCHEKHPQGWLVNFVATSVQLVDFIECAYKSLEFV
jgi:hypothetical protein